MGLSRDGGERRCWIGTGIPVDSDRRYEGGALSTLPVRPGVVQTADSGDRVLLCLSRAAGAGLCTLSRGRPPSSLAGGFLRALKSLADLAEVVLLTELRRHKTSHWRLASRPERFSFNILSIRGIKDCSH